VQSESPIFIVGCPRSGTSLLRNLLRSHPHLTFPRESHFIPAFYRAYGNPRNSSEAIRLARRILGIHWIQDWNLNIEADALSGERTFAGMVSRLFAEYARTQHKERWGDKTPQYVTEIPTLREIFPASKIIHIYRDGRDVALSWLRVGFDPHNLFTAARLWRTYVSAGRIVGQNLPEAAYAEVRYETLLSQPEETMREVCAFVGEPYDPAVLRLDSLERMRWRRLIARRRAHNMISRVAIVGSNTNKWKEEMPVQDRILFESVAGDLLGELGYEIEGLTRPVHMLEELQWKAHHRFMSLLHRMNAIGNMRFLHTGIQFRWARIRSRF
jgi:hypothetical protein